LPGEAVFYTMPHVWQPDTPILLGDFWSGFYLFQLLSHVYSKRKTSPQGGRKEVLSGSAISKTESFHQQISFFFPRRVRLSLETTDLQRALSPFYLFYFHSKVCLLERSDTFSLPAIVLKPMAMDLLGRAFPYFLSLFGSTDPSP
jgi:hypothetical protein